MEGIPWGSAGGVGAQGSSVGQTGPFFCRGQAAHGAFQAGEFRDGTGFPRKSSLAAVWRTRWRGTHRGGRGSPRDCCSNSRRSEEAVIRNGGSRDAGGEHFGRHKGGGICWAGGPGREEGGEDATRDDSQRSVWGFWKPKMQLIEMRNSEESAGGGAGKRVGEVPGLLRLKWSPR